MVQSSGKEVHLIFVSLKYIYFSSEFGFSGLVGAGTCRDNEKVRIIQTYLCNANISIYIQIVTLLHNAQQQTCRSRNIFLFEQLQNKH